MQVRGISHEPVQERERPKSMLAAKSFNATSDLSALQGWFRVLAQVRCECQLGVRRELGRQQQEAVHFVFSQLPACMLLPVIACRSWPAGWLLTRRSTGGAPRTL
jgi:hypothetical protein